MKEKRWLLPLCLLGFFLLQLYFLMDFPLMHSDESWLSGSSRSLLESGSLREKESFFDLYPRPVHLLRVCFSVLQMGMMKLFGYRLFSFRLLSLFVGTLCLWLFYRNLRVSGLSYERSLIGMGLLSTFAPFLYASHMARNDILVVAALLGGLLLSRREKRMGSLALILAFMMGVTPNSFLLGVGFGGVLFLQWWEQRRSHRDLVVFFSVVSFAALAFFLGSLWVNPHFLADYRAYALTQGVLENSVGRLQGLGLYFYKLWLGEGGTYQLLPMKWDVVLLGLALLLALGLLFFRRNHPARDTGIFLWFMLLAFVILGRYNQLAILFLLVPALLFLLQCLLLLPLKGWVLLLFLSGMIFDGSHRILSEPREDYEAFLADVMRELPGEGRVLANLNLEYGLKGRLLDVRNLSELDANQMSFSDYMEKDQVEYLVLYEEMEYLYKTRPRWNILYGDLSWYEEMQDFLEERMELISEQHSPCYGMRIGRYQGDYPWWVRIYRMKGGR